MAREKCPNCGRIKKAGFPCKLCGFAGWPDYPECPHDEIENHDFEKEEEIELDETIEFKTIVDDVKRFIEKYDLTDISLVGNHEGVNFWYK